MVKKQSDNVRVVARFRPHNEREKAEELARNITFAELNINGQTNRIETASTHKPLAMKDFTFDGVLDSDINQEGAFEGIALAPCQQLLSGYNSTIFVYGQTGSGKTYTMLGPEGANPLSNPQAIGLIPRAVMMIFAGLDQKLAAEEIIGYEVEVSFLEIYLEELRDLQDPFSKKQLRVRLGPNGDHFIPNLTFRTTQDSKEVFELMYAALANRTVSATKMNASSSRSHMVMMIRVKQDVSESEKKTSTMNFADLAGSEKMKKTEVRGKRAEEAKKINLSLTQLGIVISELAARKSHVSFRDSMLTQVLQDSLGGNCKTTLVVNLSKSLFNRDETIGTLEFGKRCKTLTTQAKVNQQFSRKQLMKMLDNLQKENAALQRKIENEEYEMAKQNVDETELLEKMELIAALRAEQDEKIAEIEALQESNQDVNRQLVASRFQTMAHKKAAASLREQIEETRKAIGQLEKDIAASHAEVQKRTELVEALQMQNQEISNSMSKHENELSIAQGKLSTREQQVETLERKVDALQAQLLGAKEANDGEKSVAMQKMRELNETLEAQLSDNRLKGEAQQERIIQVEEQIEVMQTEKDRLANSLEELSEALFREQAAHQESRFRWSSERTQLTERIAELENEVEDMALANENRAKEWQQQLRKKDMEIHNLRRHLEVLKTEALHSNANKNVIIQDVEQTMNRQLAQKEEEVQGLQSQQGQMQMQIREKMENVQDLQQSLAYLENFNKNQMKMLEEADHAYAQTVYEREQLRLRELNEQEARDAEIARRFQEEMDNRAKQREEMNKKLNIEQRHFRSSSMDDSGNPSGRSTTVRNNDTIRGTQRKKKFASTVNVGEKLKLHNNMKGVVRFTGEVHFMKSFMVGIEVIEGQGDNDGSKNGQRYFQCAPGTGKFVTLQEISHVYKIRQKDGREEKQRFSANEFVQNCSNSLRESQGSNSSTPTRQTFTRRELERLTTDAQIEIAMKMSQGSSSSDLTFEQPPARQMMAPHGGNSRKAKYKRAEQDRLMRHASVQILNELIDAIDNEDQKQMVLNDFVKNRASEIFEDLVE